MRKQLILLAITISLVLSSCAMVHTPSGGKYTTLGVANVNHCEKSIETEIEQVKEQCVTIETGAFSGWDAIAGGIANAIVKILTFGLAPTL